MSQNKKHWWLYVLKLEHGKYYVGITSQTPEKRMQEHKRGIRAAYWTQDHKPLKIIYRQDLGVVTMQRAEAFEDKVTRKYMDEYGYNNVRGGDLTDREDYKRWFGTYYNKLGWQGAMVMIALSAILILYGILSILK